ncbi:hypothetical protein [Streptomyces sp. NRRL F-5650]|uniref:hypothetical protein n=1 Tax=Streptomyces sp. NRRL F-5650 TaxID=1463868 RepID=UPI0004C9FF92|nr:hypothetical protein [Streptomyces sp. NRRL F-5650]
MARRKQATEDPEERSALAGAVVVVLLLAVVFGVLFAVSDAAGILGTVAASTVAVWWSVTRRKGSYQPLPSPTEPLPPEDELPGHGPVTIRHREGMSIFLRDDADNPARTHVHVVRHDQDA